MERVLSGGGEGGHRPPWKEPVSVTTTPLFGPYLSKEYLRAVLIAHSFASAPELEKNTRDSPVRAQSRSASSACGAE